MWTSGQATSWYAAPPWLVGANYLPRNAINEPERWQAATFDAPLIEEEFGWAEHLGFSTMRVFLHNLPWEQDARGFLERIACWRSPSGIISA